MSVRSISHVGEKFGLLTIAAHCFVGGRSMVDCVCDCGGTTTTRLSRLKNGQTRSCGCLIGVHMREFGRIHRKSALHGHCMNYRNTLTYSSWGSMKGRCLNPYDPVFEAYGGRGITVCERWLDFANFLADMGERTSKSLSLDRIDNSRGYEPENCRWADYKTQNRNTRQNRLLTHDGKTQPVVIWAEQVGLSYHVLWKRLERGWSAQKALSVPNLGRGGRL